MDKERSGRYPPGEGLLNGDSRPAPDVPGVPPSRKVATTWNVVFSYLSVALAIVRNLGFVPIYLNYISIGTYGAWLATGAVLAQLMISDFGLMGAVTQRAASAYGARQRDRLASLVGTSFIVAAGLAFCVSLLAASASPWVPRLFSLEGEAADLLFGCFLIVALANGLNLVSLTARGILRSLQRPFIPGLNELLAEGVSLTLTLLLVTRGWSLYGIAIGLAARSVIVTVSNVIGCAWVCYGRLRLSPRWSPKIARMLWTDSYYLFFTTIAVRLQTMADPFFVSIVLGAEAAGIYVLTIRSMETVRLLQGQLGAAVEPSLAHLHGGGEDQRFRDVIVKAMMVMGLFGAVGMGGAIAFNQAFVALWVGADLYGGHAVTLLFALFGIVTTLGGVPYTALFAKAEFPRLCKVAWMTTLIRVPLILSLLPFGLWGAPAAAAVCAAIRSAALGVMVNRYVRITTPELGRIIAQLLGILMPGLVLGCLFLAFIASPDGWILLGAEALGYVVLCLVGVATLNGEFLRSLMKEARVTWALTRRR